MHASIFKSTIVAFAITGVVMAAPYPDKCGDMVCPSDKPLCCGVPFNGGIGLECLAGPTCPPIPPATPTTPPVPPPTKLARAAPYPDKCGDMVCPSDKPLCCGVYFNGNIGLECLAGDTCPPIQYPTTTTQAPQVKRTAPASPTPTFGPKCGDSFFCKPGQVCCTLYTCADTPEECPK